jgi:hypothetical protein
VNEDHRRAPRRRTLKGGRIVFNDGHSTISCTVGNLSETGALLRVPSTVGIPETFSLIVGDFASEQRECRVVRRSGEQLGVAFESGDETLDVANRE